MNLYMTHFNIWVEAMNATARDMHMAHVNIASYSFETKNHLV